LNEIFPHKLHKSIL